jgi:hypothetical protein
MLRTIFIATLFASVATGALAQAPNRSGTPQEQKACAKDVSRYCRAVMNDADLVILSCLQQHRAKISKACNAVLVSHGQ